MYYDLLSLGYLCCSFPVSVKTTIPSNVCLLNFKNLTSLFNSTFIFIHSNVKLLNHFYLLRCGPDPCLINFWVCYCLLLLYFCESEIGIFWSTWLAGLSPDFREKKFTLYLENQSMPFDLDFCIGNSTVL